MLVVVRKENELGWEEGCQRSRHSRRQIGRYSVCVDA